MQTNNDNAAEDDRVTKSGCDDCRAANALEDHPQSHDAAMLDEFPGIDPLEDHRQL